MTLLRVLLLLAAVAVLTAFVVEGLSSDDTRLGPYSSLDGDNVSVTP